MKIYKNGQYIEVEDMNIEVEPIPYAERVQNRIHAVYSLDDEIAMVWKDPADPERIAYRDFVEQIKAEERQKQ